MIDTSITQNKLLCMFNQFPRVRYGCPRELLKALLAPFLLKSWWGLSFHYASRPIPGARGVEAVVAQCIVCRDYCSLYDCILLVVVTHHHHHHHWSVRIVFQPSIFGPIPCVCPSEYSLCAWPPRSQAFFCIHLHYLVPLRNNLIG